MNFINKIYIPLYYYNRNIFVAGKIDNEKNYVSPGNRNCNPFRI